VRILFAGTSSFAVPSLTQLIQASQQNPAYELIGVYTQPDRPCGRGQRIQSSPVKTVAEKNCLPVYQPLSLKDAKVQQALQALQADVMIVAAYGLIIPKTILNTLRFGGINVHASLLPRWRGAAPVQRALLAGDMQTGITIMQMEASLDTGAILAQMSMPILPQDTSGTLQTRLEQVGAALLLETLHDLPHKQNQAEPQTSSQACYAAKITKEEAAIDWCDSAAVIERKIRAFDPYPIAFSWLQGNRIRCWKACIEVSAKDIIGYAPGQIISISKDSILVATGENCLRLLELQLEGGRCLSVTQLLHAKLAWVLSGMQFTNVK